MDSRLKIFVVTASTLNFSEAARMLGITQPSVSQNIRAIEKEYGIQLFARNGHEFSLTYSGEIFLRHAKEILRKYRELEYETLMLSSVTKGNFRLAIPPALYFGMYPDMSADYCRLSPMTFFSSVIAENREIAGLVSRREINAGLIYRTLPSGDAEPVFRDTLIPVSCTTRKISGAFDTRDVRLVTYGRDDSTSEDIEAFIRNCDVDRRSLDGISRLEDPSAAAKFLIQYGQSGAGNTVPAFGFFWTSQVREYIRKGLLQNIEIEPFSGKPLVERLYYLEQLPDNGIPNFEKYLRNWINRRLK